MKFNATKYHEQAGTDLQAFANIFGIFTILRTGKLNQYEVVETL